MIRALSSWRTQADSFGALRKASIYFRFFSLKSSLELFRIYVAGSADHIRAVNLFIQSRIYYIWRCDDRRRITALRVAFARTLSLGDHSFQMIRKSAIDRARSKVFQESASMFQKFPFSAAWIQFRGDSIRFNFSIQTSRLHHIFLCFRSWRQSTVELVVVNRNYSAATNLFLAKPLGPTWPILPASLSLSSGC